MELEKLGIVTIAKSFESGGNWVIEGYLATTDFDFQGEEITPEVINDLAEQLMTRANTLCYLHKIDQPMGRIVKTWTEDNCKRLGIRAIISKTVPDKWQQIQEGVLNKLSIRAKVLDAEPVWDDKLHLYKKQLKKLWAVEGSIVPVPGNIAAQQIRWYVSKMFTTEGGERYMLEGNEARLEEIALKVKETIKAVMDLFDNPAFVEDDAKLTQFAESTKAFESALAELATVDSEAKLLETVKKAKEAAGAYYYYKYKGKPAKDGKKFLKADKVTAKPKEKMQEDEACKAIYTAIESTIKSLVELEYVTDLKSIPGKVDEMRKALPDMDKSPEYFNMFFETVKAAESTKEEQIRKQIEDGLANGTLDKPAETEKSAYTDFMGKCMGSGKDMSACAIEWKNKGQASKTTGPAANTDNDSTISALKDQIAALSDTVKKLSGLTDTVKKIDETVTKIVIADGKNRKTGSTPETQKAIDDVKSAYDKLSAEEKLSVALNLGRF